jgi:hypothetical protein
VHLFFLKLFGCMLAEAKANGFDVPIDIDPCSTAIMSGRPHFRGPPANRPARRHRRAVERALLEDRPRPKRSRRLYELDTIAVSVMYVQAGRLAHRRDLWNPHSRTSSKRFQIADFMYSKRDDAELEGSSAPP